MKKLFRYLCALVALCSFARSAFSQLTPGINVNGHAMNYGDTINVCKGSAVFYNSSASGYTAISWQFNLGSPATSTLPAPPPVIYNSVGIDSTIQVVYNSGQTDTFYIMVQVTDTHPVIDFTSNNNVCSGTQQQFNSVVVSGTAPFVYAWTFGDGGTSASSNPVHTFNSPGCSAENFTNTLTVTDRTGCTSTITKSINVLQAPELEVQDPDLVPFSNCENSPTPSSPNFTIQLNNVSPGAGCITSYSIDWGDGNIQTNITFPVTHTYTQIGAFNLVVSATGANGCSTSKTYTIANQTNPAGSLGTLGTTSNLCAPATVPFTIGNWQINSPGTLYVLEYGDGTTDTLTHPLNSNLTLDTIYHTYTTSSCPAGSFVATLKVINGCGYTPYSAGGIQVLKKAQSSFSVSASSFCVGQSVCFANTTLAGAGPGCLNIATTSWDFGDGSPAVSTTSPCHVYSQPGIYTVTLTTTNYCGPSTYSMNICVTTPPVPGFSVDNTEGCVPFVVNTTNTTTSLNNCNIASYLWTVAYAPANCGSSALWSFVGASTATSSNPSFVFNNAGSYTITLAVTNACGTFTYSRTISVKQPPIVSVAPVAPHCGPVTITPSATVTACGSGPLAYSWTFTGGSPANSSILNPGPVSFAAAGPHTITLSVTNECGTTTSSQQFIIDTVSAANAGPDQNICGTIASLAANTPLIGTGSWSYISGPVIPVFADVASPASGISGLVPGTYILRWTMVNGSCTGSDDVSITILTGPTPAAAGPDQELCLASSVTMAGNTPAIGAGTWSYVSGPPGSFITDLHSPSTTISGLQAGVYVFRWTINFANCNPGADDVQVTIFNSPSPADAGTDQVICSSATSLTGNIPVFGNGAWSYVSGPAVPSITNAGAPTATITGLVTGVYTFKWTISNGVCPPSEDLVQVTVTALPTIAAAGPDQSVCASTSITLNGNIPAVGAGQWSYISGPTGYTITDPALPNTTVTGLVPGATYIFEWTISNSVCPPSHDQVQIVINDNVTIASAGPSQDICGTQVTMAANTPVIGTGHWSYISGPAGAVITNAGSPATIISSLVPGTYVFRWTIVNGSCSSSSDVSIIIRSGPTPANAGPDQDLCLATAATLNANAPVIGTGLWTLVSGPAGSSISTPNVPATDITGILPGTYILRWTTSFANCPPSSDDVKITVYDNPTIAAAGPDQTICSSVVTLAANQPVVGIGAWTLVSGPPGSSFADASLAAATVNGLVPGTYLFRWTISSGACPASSDDVQIFVNQAPSVASAGPDQVLCGATGTVMTAQTPATGSGLWSYVSGPAGYSIADPSSPSSAIPGIVPGATYVFQWTVTNGVCPPSIDQVQITNYAELNAQASSPVTVICAGQEITVSCSDPIGGNGMYSYQWQQSTDGINWTNIALAQSQDYTSILTQSIYLRCHVSSLPCEIFTNVLFIEVQPAVTNNTIAADQSICINTPAAPIAGSTPAGGDGNYQFQWQQSNDGITWVNIPGATGINYDPGTMVQTTYYRRIVNTTLCNGPQANVSAPVMITVNNDAKALFAASPTIGCAPFNLANAITVSQFADRNGQYQWFADGILIGTTTGAFPGYTISDPGSTVIIKLRTVSPHGCKPDSMEIAFSTVPTAFARFTRMPAAGCGPLTVNLVNTSSILDAGIQYFWNFGNGLLSTNMQPGAVTFGNNPAYRDTTYYITLKAFNGCDTTYYYDSVKVFPNSKARFAVDTTRGCSPFTIHIQNLSGGNNTAYYWDFGDGTVDTTHSLGSLTHTFYTGEIRNDTIRLISENQCTRDTQYMVIVVSPNTIQPYISANGNMLIGCAPHLVVFNNSSIGASQLTWNFGDGSPLLVTPNTQNSVSHLFNNGGVYNVSIRLQNDCSDTTVYRTITVYDPPTAAFTADLLKVCTSQPVSVTNLSANANSYEWIWGDGSTNSFAEGQHTFSSPGDYEVMLVAKRVHTAGFVCYDTAVATITVVDKIPAQIAIQPGNACVPYTLNVSAGNISGFSSLKWVIYDSSTAQGSFTFSGLSASHIYDVPGVYSVRLIVYTTPTCIDSVSYPFRVYPTPKTSFSPLLITTCSHDTTITYTAATTGTGGMPVNYTWLVNGSIEGNNNPFIYNFQTPLNNSAPAEYNIQALAQNQAGCGDTSLSGKLIVQPLPFPKIVVSPSVVLQQPDYLFNFEDMIATNPNKKYVWYMGDRSQQTRNGQKVSYQYADTGTYSVKLLVTDFGTGCSAWDSVNVTVLYIPGYLYVPNAICLGCSNAGLRQFLPLGKGLKTYRLRVYNAYGQKIFETDKLDANGSPSEAWNGTFGGKPNSPVLQQDAYTWQIEATYINGTEWKGMLYPGSNKAIKAGFITIIK